MWVLLFTLLGFAVMGYHPGLEDDGFYLTAVKADLNPALYPHNAGFFRLQMQAMVFDKIIAAFVRVTHIPLEWSELLWQFLSIFMILWACHSIARRLFKEASAQWAAVAMVAAMFTLPVAGTALFLVDQHLHPRAIATALILLAIARVMEGKAWQAAVLLALSAFIHPMMAAFGFSFCLFLTLALNDRVYAWVEAQRVFRQAAKPRLIPAPDPESGGEGLLVAAPLSWVFASASPDWRAAMNMHSYYYLYKWEWYEWLGAVAPVMLFWLFWRWARKRGEKRLARFALAIFAFGVFQQAVAFAMLTPTSLIRLTPLQPMRYLHLVYFALALAVGGLMGQFLLKKSLWRWAAYLLVFNAGMLASQELQVPASPHLELPGITSSNEWVEAFAWVKQNTPVDAYFALDPNYIGQPGEDAYGFRALAERSSLADAIKDSSTVTQIPPLGGAWVEQVDAEQGWNHFGIGDFERLKRQFGVDWVVVNYPSTGGLDCHWHNRRLAVCQIP